jgi:2,3-bisphosphoglycerate-independent phosphoglycerate mutase
VKKTDSLGEDGNFDGRVHKIEEVDKLVPRIRALGPDVICVTGDHSTPAVFKAHTWHPVPVLVWGKNVRKDMTQSFGERQAIHGGLGRFPGSELMLDLLAHAGKLKKMGA